MSTNLPLTGFFEITATYKQRNSKLWSLGFHTGLDFIGSDDIYSTCDGIVDTIAYSSAYGNYIIIKEDNENRYHYFCHLKSVKVTRGQRVSRTTRIGIMGSTGNSTGKHLHYEIRKQKGTFVESNFINPADYCRIPNEKGEYNSADYQLEDKPTISYEAHVENIGWQESRENGEIAGTEGKGLRLEAINIHSNFPLKYRVHIENKGWTDFVNQDSIAGTVGEALRLEAIHIIADREIVAKAHVENIGWQEDQIGKEIIIGTEGKALRLEALRIAYK